MVVTLHFTTSIKLLLKCYPPGCYQWRIQKSRKGGASLSLFMSHVYTHFAAERPHEQCEIPQPGSLTPSTNDDAFSCGPKKAVIYCIIAGVNDIHERIA